MIERSVKPNTQSKRIKQGVELASTERVNTNALHALQVMQATIKTAKMKSVVLLTDNYNQFATTEVIFDLYLIEILNVSFFYFESLHI